MIPIRDVIPTRTTPVVTLTLAAVHLAVLLYVSLGDPSGALLVYLALNILLLWLFGENVEDRMGHARFLGFYVVCAVAAGMARALVAPGLLRVEWWNDPPSRRGRRQRAGSLIFSSRSSARS